MPARGFALRGRKCSTDGGGSMTPPGAQITGERPEDTSVWRWTIEEDTLLLESENGRRVVPSADSIYSLRFENRISDELPDATPSDLPVTLSFSRYPLDLTIRLVSDAGDSG